MKTMNRIARIAVAAALLAAGTTIAPRPEPAQAATCWTLGAVTIRVCGTWNASGYTDADGVQYYKTTSFGWTVRPSDPQVIIKNVTITTSGLSGCTGRFQSCVNFKYHNNASYDGNLPRDVTWSKTIFPAFTGKWGQVTGGARHQGSNVTITWYRSRVPDKVFTETTGNIGVGPR